MSTTTNLDKLKINYLTQEQYEDAVENEEINENELYFTPGHNNDAIVPVELTQAAYDALTTEQKNNGMVYCVSDANGTYLTASEVSYGSSSVQDALDDLTNGITYTGTLAYDVDISSYTTTDRYTVPVDGYVWVRTFSSAEINMPNITHTIRSVNGESAHGCVFVQKGVPVCVTGTPAYALFRAFRVAE